MKLLKKLLPLATLASTAAVVAPMVASCGNGSVNLYKKYTPSIDQYKETQVDSAEKGIELYFSEAAKNPQIIVQDYYYTNCKDTTVPSGVTASGSIKLSNVKVDTTNKVLSFNYEEHTNASGEAEGIKGQEKSDINYSVANIPYIGEYDSYSKKWVFTIDPTLANWKDNTKVEGSVYAYAKQGDTELANVNTGKQTITKTTDVTKADEKLQTVYYGLFTINWYSYHFEKVTVKAA